MERMNLTVFREWLDFFRNKQSDHLNAMVGVGLGFIFGFFSVIYTNPYVLVPFTIVIVVIFLHFYGRYYYYYRLEVVVRLTMDLESNSLLAPILSRHQIQFSEEDYFFARIREPWFKEYSTEAKKEKIHGIPFWINDVGKKLELALCIIWGFLVLVWTIYPPDLLTFGIICVVGIVVSLILYIMSRKQSQNGH